MIMGDITPAKPIMADAALPTEPHVESLEILDAPKVRTKPRMFAILASLYVQYLSYLKPQRQPFS